MHDRMVEVVGAEANQAASGDKKKLRKQMGCRNDTSDVSI